MDESKLLETCEAGRVLNLTPASVRWLAAKGTLPVAVLTSRGQRLFRRADVEGLAKARRKRAAAAASKQPVTAPVEAVSPDLTVNGR